jgi:hypothetical protein
MGLQNLVVSPVLDRQGTDGVLNLFGQEEDRAMWRSRIMHRATYEERLAEAFTQEKLRDLAAEYFQRAVDIESKEKAA